MPPPDYLLDESEQADAFRRWMDMRRGPLVEDEFGCLAHSVKDCTVCGQMGER